MAYRKDCEECGEAMMMIQTEGGKWIPVDIDTYTDGEETFDDKVHVAHFATCTKPERFRRGPLGEPRP